MDQQEQKNQNSENPQNPDDGKGNDAGQPSEMPLEDRIWGALRQCYDPEIPVNIVDLGLIYDVSIDDVLEDQVNVFVKMTLTAPGCGMGPMIAADVKRRVQSVRGVTNVRVDLVFDPPWNPSLMTEAAKLQLNMY